MTSVSSMYPYLPSRTTSTHLFVWFLREGNPVDPYENLNTAADCAPCADSNLSLKEQISKLDGMVLLEGNDSESDQTDDTESIA